ncbi:cell division cycle and apoptosis regulator protein 1-like isoform X2 [Phlebotomus papatasi]|uniref:cell division cycle and apoptosis regulator protein 1-like isoform X2 n=1 Tax=Phlebotomus papatasi TaxID=29031 RepID=UPI0024842865|nr:cell division cycle and apoptosis regulator protein 1-like isoform X2 [Phlebotomus papatasi]
MSYDKPSACPPPPPWVRNSNLQTQLGLTNQALVTYAQNQPVYNSNIAMAQQQNSQQQAQNISLISQISGSLASQLPPNQIYTQTVSYPNPRTLNPIAFNQQPSSGQQSHQSTSQTLPLGQTAASLAKSHGIFNGIGVVTKMQGDVGFIDKEVFFNKNVCAKGSFPKVGDRVLVEVSYNQKMPFKWNATRVQVVSAAGSASLPMQSQNRSLSMTHKSSTYSSASPAENGSNYSRSISSRSSRAVRTPSPPRISERTSSRSRDPRLRDPDPRSDEDDRKRRRETRDKDKYRERRGSTPDRRERSPPRRSPPKKRRTRAIPRYMVQVPKVSLTVKDADVLVLKRRYNNLYIPSDFFHTNVKWPDAFPPNVPFSIHKPCSFHIMRKDVEPVICGELPPEPADADYLFSAKVMLMGSPPMEELYGKCITTAEEREKDDEKDFVHPSRLINFLVGIRGKNEAMAIGGPWSPSMDGENPQSDVSVLIRTAIRSCKSLTGIDLSNCTQWYRFVELYYRRGEVVQKGRVVPPRIETVVIFLPDVRSCIPTRLEWDELQGKYRRALDRILQQDDDASPSDGESLATSGIDQGVVVDKAAAAVAEDEEKSPDVAPKVEEPSVSTDAVAEEKPSAQEEEKVPAEAVPDEPMADAEAEKESEDVDDPTPVNPDDGGVATEKDENADDVVPGREPTHFSLLDPKTMKIQEIRDELSARNISPKGLKPQLAARLVKVLKSEALEAKKEIEEAAAELKKAFEPVTVQENVEAKESKKTEEATKDEESKEEEEEAKEEEKVEETTKTEEVEESTKVEESVEVSETKEEEKIQETEEAKETEDSEKVEETKEADDEEKADEKMETEEVKESEEPMDTEESKNAEDSKEGKEAEKEEESKEADDSLEAGEIVDEPKVSKEEEDSQFNENELGDLVIIDEVGGSRAAVKTPEEKPRKAEKKPLDEREKQILEKKYTLPEAPQIIVHPSKMAKNGKFECTVMSLSVLLDYRPEDTKEHTFEVSLFAELFNEMLMRDFGFNIYKALNMMPEKNKEPPVEPKKEEKKADCVVIEDSPAKESSAKKASEEKVKDEKEVKEKVDDDASAKSKKIERDSRSDRESRSERERSERSRHYDDSDDDSVSVRSGEKRKREKDRQKYYTAFPDLLLSFVYFDQSHCGYIFEKDIEDLFFTLGLDLSRAQIRKLVGKAISRDALYYRRLTEKVKEEKQEPSEDAIEEKKENLEDSLSDDILKGNKIYLPVFKDMLKSLESTDEPPLKKIKTEESDDAPAVAESSSFVMHNGGIVDVEKLLGQMSRSEKALEDTEKLLVDLRQQIADLQSSNSKANSKIKDLSSDLRSVSRKLSDTEQTLNTTQKRCNEYYSILSSVNDRVAGVFAKSDKSHRSDSRSREPRERDRESKESSKSETTKKDD